MSFESDHKKAKGLIAWMIYDKITPNLLMIILLIGGFYTSTQITQELFPTTIIDNVRVTMSYPGASPAEVEQGIVLAMEEAIRGIEGIDEASSFANEGRGILSLDLHSSADRQQVFQEVKTAIDRIRTFPLDAEEPEVSLNQRRRQVLNIEIYGNTTEWALREITEQVRDYLLDDPEISQIEMNGARNYEIHVEIPQDTLRAYGLTLQEVARTISQTAVEVPGGGIKTDKGEILIRMMERRNWAEEFATIPVITTMDGTVVYLEDIADIRDGFMDTDIFARYNGSPALGLEIYRVGEQTPQGVSEAVHERMVQLEPSLPPGIEYVINNDLSAIYKERMDMMLTNAVLGLILVMVLLSIFLEFKLAFWVVVGIMTSFLGAFLIMINTPLTLNLISLFAFIVALGIVVDDAIIAGENIYEHRQQGMGYMDASAVGAKQIALPLSFAILTNIIAFSPMLFVPGGIGMMFFQIPAVVISVFLISWFEALFILPSHIAHTDTEPKTGLGKKLHTKQQQFSLWFTHIIKDYYGPFLQKCMDARYLTVACGLGILFTFLAWAISGRMGLYLMPTAESDVATVRVSLPVGTPLHKKQVIRDQIVTAINRIQDDYGEEQIIGVFDLITTDDIMVTAYMAEEELRPLSASQLNAIWREETGPISGIENIRFISDQGGPGGGRGLTVELSHRDVDVLDRAGTDLADILAQFPQVKDTNDGFIPGKEQLDFKLKEEGQSLGLTTSEVARQVRNAFYGAEAIRQQRGRNEIKVMVRLPEEQRIKEYDIETLMIRTPMNTDVPLMQIAEVTRGRAYSQIERSNSKRAIDVEADVDPAEETNQIVNSLQNTILPELIGRYPGLTASFQGRQEDMNEGLAILGLGMMAAIVIIYIMLAIPLRSYIQPAIIMTAIPFGIVGAIIGHMILGLGLSLVSMMGVVALSGVVVNDSLVMIDYANRIMDQSKSAMSAIYTAAVRRFRPIMLTTLTTFGGLSPIMLEDSPQAQFMVPMAVSLGFGILFSTMILLLLVPCLYIIVDDLRGVFGRKAPDPVQAEPSGLQ